MIIIALNMQRQSAYHNTQQHRYFFHSKPPYILCFVKVRKNLFFTTIGSHFFQKYFILYHHAIKSLLPNPTFAVY